MNWIYALILILSSIIILFSVMSIVNIFMIGPRKAFLQIKTLLGFKVDKVFYKKHVLTSNLYPSIRLDNNYYFFVGIKSDTNVVVFRSLEDFISYPTVHNITRVGDEWKYEEVKMNPSMCMLTHLLKEIVSRKMSKSIIDATPLEDEGLDKFINTQLTQLVRDKKLNSILK